MCAQTASHLAVLQSWRYSCRVCTMLQCMQHICVYFCVSCTHGHGLNGLYYVLCCKCISNLCNKFSVPCVRERLLLKCSCWEVCWCGSSYVSACIQNAYCLHEMRSKGVTVTMKQQKREQRAAFNIQKISAQRQRPLMIALALIFAHWARCPIFHFAQFTETRLKIRVFRIL